MPTAPIEASTNRNPSVTGRRTALERQLVTAYLVLLALLLLALVPPLINVNRFKRRIVTSISTTLGRPVHLDRVSLNVLPFPGFTLENFVVAEDPAFGNEPTIRANTVRVRLRIASLWRRKVEFSTISLDEPSLNLVHNAQGRWNFESILRQTSQLAAAPTGQLRAGRDPRFPYIEATGARVNVKSGVEKLPFSLTEADLALWLPEAQQWNLRLKGRPSRTNTSASDTGTITVDGTLGRASTFAQAPLDLSLVWQRVPLGEATTVVLGRDIGLRGQLAVSLEVHGTAQDAIVKSHIQMSGIRRAAFVPVQAVDVNVECQANAARLFHAFHAIRCTWPPPPAATSGLGLALRSADTTTLLALTGEVGDVYDPASQSVAIGAPGLPAQTLLEWLRVASARVPPDEQATGVLTAKFLHQSTETNPSSERAHRAPNETWTGSMLLQGASLNGGALGPRAVRVGDLALHAGRAEDGAFILEPTSLTLGGREPAMLDGRLDRNGYVLHLVGMIAPERLTALAGALPQFGDGINEVVVQTTRSEQPVKLDLVIARPWGGAQRWSRAVASPAPKRRHQSGR